MELIRNYTENCRRDFTIFAKVADDSLRSAMSIRTLLWRGLTSLLFSLDLSHSTYFNIQTQIGKIQINFGPDFMGNSD